MQRTDLDTPFLTIPLNTERTSSRFVRLTCSRILIISCTIFGYSQCYAQDVVEAARQEQARKQSQQKKSKHVYTDEDLKHAQILTPEDRAEVEARKAQQPLPGVDSRDPLDAEALPLDAPLGDVARRYRRLRELQRLQQSAEFHLPFSEEQVHATPKPSVLIPIEAPVLVSPKPRVTRTVISIPAPPPRVEPFQPPVRRSPFERPLVFSSAPPRIASSQPSANHAVVPEAPPVSSTIARPSTIPIAPTKPAAPPPVVHLMPPNRTAPRVTPAEPAAPAIRTTPSQVGTLPAMRSKPSAPAHDFSVVPPAAHAVHVAPPQPTAPVVGAVPSHASALPVTPSEPAAPKPDFRLMPSPEAAVRVAPVQPMAPVVAVPSHPSMPAVTTEQPAAPKPDFRVMPSPAATVRVAPARPVAAVVGKVPSHASIPTLTPAEPVAPKPDLSVMPSPGRTQHASPAQPVPPAIAARPSKPSVLGVNPSQPAAPAAPVAPPKATAPARTAPAGPVKLNMLTVQPGDSLWKLAQQNLGEGVRWHELLAANPAIVDPNHIVAGSHIFLPSIASRFRTATSIIVQKGDTLSGIARTQLGHTSYWSCIAHANTAIRDANLIYEGQSLLLPASCKP